MKRIVCVLSLIFLICAGANAQSFLSRLGSRAKNAVENKVGDKVEEAITGALDGSSNSRTDSRESYNDNRNREVSESRQSNKQSKNTWICTECGARGNTGKFCAECGAKKPVPGGESAYGQGYEARTEPTPATETPATEAPATEAPKSAQIKNAKDFVRGSVVLFSDKFENDPIGEFPAHWDLIKGVAEVVAVDDVKAVKLSEGACLTPYIEPNIRNYLPDEFTLEFKFLVNPEFDINGITFYTENGDELFYEHYTNYRIEHDGNIQTTTDFSSALENGWHQCELSFNKGAYKVYINGQRVVNSPREKQPNYFTLDVIDFEKAYYTDIILCSGAKEKHEQQATNLTEVERAMQETGKFVTNNILFETGKSTLKPESMEEIRKVADYMKKNTSARFEVQGHTDNQGSDKINDPLSQQRAEAVVKALAELGVDEWNLRPVGKGSHEPVADNSTEDGRAKNRRVEFIKK